MFPIYWMFSTPDIKSNAKAYKVLLSGVKFEVIGQLLFHKGILPSHVAKFPFQKLQYV